MPANRNRRVLVIDDNRAIHDDFRKILCPDVTQSAAFDATEAAVFGLPADTVQETQFAVDSAYQGQDGVLLLKDALDAGRPYALAFVDVRMPPGLDGVETTRKLWELDPDLQVVLCTAYSDYSWGEMFAKLGQHDGLLILKKPFDAVEAFQLAHALTEKWWLHQQSRRKMEELESQVAKRTRELQESNQSLQTEVSGHERAERLMRESEEKFLQLAGHITDVFWITTPDMQEILYVSPACEKLWGRSVQSLRENPHEWQAAIHPEDRGKVTQAFAGLANAETNVATEYRVVQPDGGLRWVMDRRYVVRDKVGKIYRTVGIASDITERKQAEDAIHESEERFSSAFEYGPIGVALVSPEGRWLKVNRALCTLVGYSEAELLTRTFQDITHPEDLGADLENLRRLTAGEIDTYQMEKRYAHARGHFITVLLNVSLIRDHQGQPRYFIAQIQDITERQRLEAQLFQSQKLETVGKLAGGIAHEFNSILTAIIGQSELLLTDLPAGSPLTKNANEISKAAGRAATLTRQLLAYGRKQIFKPEVLDLNRILSNMEGMFHHVLGEAVDARIVPGPGLHLVKADAGQLEQVIMNMVMNAREAMPNRGQLTLETANVSFDQESVAPYPELRAGDYVMLAITDTGSGMSKEVKARVFEPFFSTKAVGQGTGLGLSTCYGIIKQSGGHISVYSEVGRGTTFKVYVPQVESGAPAAIPRLAAPDLPRGTESILLVEDDPALREVVETLLHRLGYTVFTAANGIEALNLTRQHGVGHIDLLFTDVVMPHMSGKELADRVRVLYPHTKILFTSAYTENAIVHQGVLNTGVVLLQKPFTPSAFARKVREILDQPPALPSSP